MTTPTVDQALLDQLRAALQRTIEFGIDTLAAPAWEPAPGSEAAAEITEAVKELGDDRHIRTAYAAANLQMTGVLDQLGSLQHLLWPPLSVLGPVVVSRSAVEIASTAWWLMEPGIGMKTRLSRELALSLDSAHEAGVVANLMFGPGPDLDEVLDQKPRVRQRIAAAGLTSSGTNTVNGQKPESATQMTAALLHAGLGTKDAPTHVYKSYSATTHGTLYGLMNFTVPITAPDGSPRLVWSPNRDVLDSAVQVTIVAFEQAWKRINTVMGWDTTDLEQAWTADLAKIFS
jgi:hypothetical protein